MLNYSRRISVTLSVGIAIAWAGCASAPRSATQPSAPVERTELEGKAKALLLIDVANGALLEGDPTAALVHLQQAEREDASIPELYHSRALAYYVKKELALAISAAEKAVRLRPEYSDAQNTLGKLRIDAGRLDAAIPPLQRAAADLTYGDAYKAYTNLGMIYYRKHDLPAAERALDQAVAANSERACIAHYYLGHVHLKRRQLSQAEREYGSASKKQCAGFVDAHYALAIAYEHSKKFDLARRKLVEIQTRYPDTAFADQAASRLKNLQ